MSVNHILKNFPSAENFPEWKSGPLARSELIPKGGLCIPTIVLFVLRDRVY